jgi:hypothetical protein
VISAGLISTYDTLTTLKRGMTPLDTKEPNTGDVNDNELIDVMDRIVSKYGRSGSGRASALRLIGAYLVFQLEGPSGFRKRGFSRMSVQLYRDKLNDANVKVR